MLGELPENPQTIPRASAWSLVSNPLWALPFVIGSPIAPMSLMVVLKWLRSRVLRKMPACALVTWCCMGPRSRRCRYAARCCRAAEPGDVILVLVLRQQGNAASRYITLRVPEDD